MNSEKFVIENSLEANYLCVELTEPCQLDLIAMRVLREDWPEFLVSYQIKRVNNQIFFRYRLMNTVALEYNNMTLPKTAFLKMFRSLLFPFINGKDWFLDYHNLCVDPRYIYLSRNGDKAYFIYVPEKSFRNTDEEILVFFKKVFSDTAITDDKDFQLRLYKYFTGSSITLLGLYELMLEEGKVPAVNSVRYGQNASEQIHSQVSLKEKVQERKYHEKDSVAVNKLEAVISSDSSDSPADDKIMDILFGDNKKKKEKPKKEKKSKEKIGSIGGIFRKKKENRVVVSEELAGTAVVNQKVFDASFSEVPNKAGAEETEISGMYEGPYLELIYSEIYGAPQKIDLNFKVPFLIIGRISDDETKPDITFPTEFKRIGRRHARIDRRVDGYYIIDLGSVNHTFLDGQRLIPNQPCLLCNGMELQFTESKPVRYRVYI